VEYAPEQHRSFRVSILFVGYTLGAALGGMLTDRDAHHWGVLTIGTGLGNARFTMRSHSRKE
jgi:predicted MFS family arabinose efflux permease